MQSLIAYLLPLIYLANSISAAMSLVTSVDLNSPAHVYKIRCNSNTRVTGRVTWNDNSDLDVYVFYEGYNFLNNSASVRGF